MRLESLQARSYRSLLDVNIAIGGINLFIGANASGKSTILDALRLLSEAVRERDFNGPLFARGWQVHSAWKGAHPKSVQLALNIRDGDDLFSWDVRILRTGLVFHVDENVHRTHQDEAPTHLLQSSAGQGWWWSGERRGIVQLSQTPTSCALAAAAADASFPAHHIVQFVRRWGFFDPSPFLLRGDWSGIDSSLLDHYGRNLGVTLYRLDKQARARILEATKAIVGLPESIEPMLSEQERRFYFVQREPGLQHPVPQMGVSSGTLRVLALMTALHTNEEAKLIGIEEPENYVHPGALLALIECLANLRDNTQLVITTHSPLVLDALGDPEPVRVVRRDEQRGTVVEAADAEGVRRALDASGFGLGEYYQTRGFGN